MQQGPRDWLSGGRHWDETPTAGRSTPRPPAAGPRLAYRPASRRGSWFWTVLAVIIGAGAAAALYASSQLPGRVSPIFGLVGGVGAVIFGIAAWRTRPYRGAGWSVLLPAAAIAAGILSTGVTAATFHSLTMAPSASASTAGQREVAPIAARAETPAPPPAAVATPVPADAPARPAATRLSLAQTLGTLQFALKLNRSADGLESPTLAVTSDGRVLDPFSASPDYVLAVLPQDTTLTYVASVDRRNYALVLVSNADPSLVARFDTVNGTVQFG